MIRLRTPLNDEDTEHLKIGDKVLLGGTIYTARDKAHQRMIEALKKGEALPFDLKGQVVFYAGPAATRPGRTIGSIGPTTSGRMDVYTSTLLEKGLKGMIGKGRRSEQVKESIRKNKAVYLAATGGAAALLAKHVVKAEVLAFEELGPEAIYRLEVEDFPAIVAVDSQGHDLFAEATRKFQKNA